MERTWLPPALLQIGAADCGPAVLASALQGFGRSVAVSELRERLHSDQEGTSIGDLERVARELGLEASEEMVPPEHLFDGSVALPAIVVVLLADGRTHFVLLWRRAGRFFLALDPAQGRLFSGAGLASRLLIQEHPVAAADWREWAAGETFQKSLERRLRAIGLHAQQAGRHLARANAEAAALPLAALDAAARCAAELVAARALRRSDAPARIARLLPALEATDEPAAILSPRWWSALPRPDGSLLLRGALLVRLAAPPAGARDELRSPPPPARAAWRAPRMPVAVAAAASGLLAAAEGLGLASLTRGFEGGQRLAVAGAVGVAGLLAAGGALEILAQRRAMAAGRREEIAARIDFAERLPELPEVAIATRSRSDLADRVHGAVALRHGPYTLGGTVRALAELAAILAGLAHLAPAAALAALAGSGIAVAGAAASRRRLGTLESAWREECARLATLAGDAARGAAGTAAWGLRAALRAEHETALLRWSRTARARARLRGLYGAGIAGATAIAGGFALAGTEPAGLLLVGWWMLRIPALGDELVGRAADGATVGAIRNRLDELRGLPHAPETGPEKPRTGTSPASLQLRGVGLRLGGAEILRHLDLDLAPGKEVALVGPSGAGKSSLGRLLLGLHPASEGEIRMSGALVRDARELRAATGFVDGHEILPDEPLAELLVRDGQGRPRSVALLEALALAGLEQAAEGDGSGLLARPRDLPAAQLQRIRLARGAGMPASRLVVLDESFRGLDPAAARALKKRLRDRSPEAILIHITHDLAAALEADRIVVLAGGEVIEAGTGSELLAGGGPFAEALSLAREDPFGAWPPAPPPGEEAR